MGLSEAPTASGSSPTASGSSPTASEYHSTTVPQRSPTAPEAAQLEAQLTSRKEIPGNKICYRLSQDIPLDYGPIVNVYNINKSSYIVNSDFVNIISKCITRCHRCNQKLKYKTVGFAFAQTFTATCKNRHCDFDKTFSPVGVTLGNFFINNLRGVYVSLVNDDGWIGLTRFANAIGVCPMSKGAYYRHANKIYNLYHTFYKSNIQKVHQNVKDFFFRNYQVCTNAEYIDIAVSIDGTYAHTGHFSRFGASFVIEVITGFILDFSLLEKCFKCPNHMDYKTNGTCPKGLFHGCSGSMEVENAKILFTRSTDWGFRYTTYISDGDCKVYPHLKNLNLYSVPIEKTECANHLAKRAKKN